MWAAFVPAALGLLGLIFNVHLSHTVSEIVNLATFAYFSVLLAPFLWSLFRANPGVLRLRVMRRVLIGFSVTIIGAVGLAIADGISDQHAGPVLLTLAVMAFGGIGFIFLALFIGLLDESKDVIERYRSQHTGASDA
jgi:hypothetical protein